MNRTQIVLLLAVLGLATFYVGSRLDRLETEKREHEQARYFPELKEQDVESIVVTCREPSFTYELRRNGDRWYLDGHLASREKSPQLVMSLVELTTEKEIAATPSPNDAKEFGLDRPTYTISLTANGGKPLGTVLLGQRTPGQNHFYGQRQEGGAIATVPAFLLGVLEEEPEELREMSPLPVSVPSVDRLVIDLQDQQAQFRRPAGREEGFEWLQPTPKPADESRLSDLMFLLRDLRVARFLQPSETTDLGPAVARYRAHEAHSQVDVVVEFCQPVAVNPSLRYGRRYLTDPEQSVAREGTEERFVIALLPDSKALASRLQDFEDRRVRVLDVDQVKEVAVRWSTGASLRAERLPQGGWRLLEPTSSEENGDESLGTKVDKLLWALRDLRTLPSEVQPDWHPSEEWGVTLKLQGGQTEVFGFGRDKSGKPLVGLGSQRWFLQEDGVPALTQAARTLADGAPATSTPTPSP